MNAIQVSTWYLCASGHCVGATNEGKSGPVGTGLTGLATMALTG